MSTFHRIPIVSILVVSLLVGCGPVDDRKEVKEERVLPSGHEAPELRKSMRERFTMGEMVGMEDPNAGKAGAEAEEGGGENLADFLDWKLPEDWKEVTPTDMRLINLRFGEGDTGECFLTLLPGGGGGLAANIGRWYGQMGKAAPDQGTIDGLPRKVLLGRDAVEVDLEGTYAPGLGAPPKEGFRFIGRILPPAGTGQQTFSLYLKMTGPSEVVTANEEKFGQFVESLVPKQ